MTDSPEQQTFISGGDQILKKDTSLTTVLTEKTISILVRVDETTNFYGVTCVTLKKKNGKPELTVGLTRRIVFPLKWGDNVVIARYHVKIGRVNYKLPIETLANNFSREGSIKLKFFESNKSPNPALKEMPTNSTDKFYSVSITAIGTNPIKVII